MPVVIRTLAEEGATEALGRSLARLLRPGDVVALSGALGAGKTTLARAVAAGLGVEPGLVSSPTFVFVNQYPVPAGAGTPLAGGQLVHVDAYRLGGEEELESLGWDRLFDPATGEARGPAAALVEWPERIGGALPAAHASVALGAASAGSRRARIDMPESWASREGFAAFLERGPARCPTTGRWVEPLAPTYPFADARARDADLYGWFAGRHVTSRPIDPAEDEGAPPPERGAGGP